MDNSWHGRCVGPAADGKAFPPEVVDHAKALVYARRRVRLMLLHIDGAKCLSPLVSDMNLEQLDAMLNLLSSTATLESL